MSETVQKNREQVIHTFYGLQSDGKWAESFENCLSDQFKTRWPDGPDSFVRGYGLVRSVYNLKVEPLRHTDERSHFEVEYKTKELILSHEITDKIKSIQLKDKRALNKGTKEFAKFLVDLGGDPEEAQKLQFLHFFKDEGVNSMLWLVKLPYKPEIIGHFKQNERDNVEYKRFADVIDTEKGPRINGLKYHRHQLPE